MSLLLSSHLTLPPNQSQSTAAGASATGRPTVVQPPAYNHCWLSCGNFTELRKERSERAAGGVNPGEEAYYAAAARGQVNAPAPSYNSNDYSSQDVLQLQRPAMLPQQPVQPLARPTLAQSSSRGRQPGMPGALAGGAEAGIMQEWSSPEVSTQYPEVTSFCRHCPQSM